MNNSAQKPGLRERKRRETLQRITDTGLKLFLSQGYEETTLDAIAEASGISRRTFFYYFKSKEEILLAWQSGTGAAIAAAIQEQTADKAPIDAVLDAILSLASQFDANELVAIERLLRSTEELRASKHAKYVQQEGAVFEALCAKWPQARRRDSLRLIAMASMGALRLAVDRWVEEGTKRPLAKHLRETFESLKAELGRQS
ncbi:TetR family transcriptional regulator [Hyphomicrobium sp. LHD-15]|uniref:TetR/AcrR family transcriptional regulator n=1 Tax=Hyphomicrobium sp. LHD-15 TaxID=3072142 RepID=UPI00280F15D8|nr:TetR family transcriptional regulator [Hyphomicrobium sp. LHD-15]MDQ8700873.1 TetR family transcriptional regulator [Hyphomicrobium sp. LHD-15]